MGLPEAEVVEPERVPVARVVEPEGLPVAGGGPGGGVGGGTDFPVGEVRPVPDEPEEPGAGVVPEAVVVDGPGLVAEPVGVLGGPVGLVGVPGSMGSGLERVILVEMVGSIREEP